MISFRIDLTVIGILVLAGLVAETVSVSQSATAGVAALDSLKPVAMQPYMYRSVVALALPKAEHHGSHGRGHLGHRRSVAKSHKHGKATKHPTKKAK
jgi:hypothetical protein